MYVIYCGNKSFCSSAQTLRWLPYEAVSRGCTVVRFILYNNNNNNNNNKCNNENSLLTYFKQIAIHKLKVLQFISMKKETTFKPIFFLIKLLCYSY